MKKLPQLKELVNRRQFDDIHRPMFSFLDKDIPAGIVLFLVALPLCLGIALASGAPLISGLISGVIGGLVIGYISKSGTSVSGPAASVSAVVLVAIQTLGGFELFLVALVIAGIIQILLGIVKAGLIAEYMPTSIIKGLLAAIGVILILSQLPYAIGLEFDRELFLNFSNDYFGNLSEITVLFFDSVSIGALFLTLFSLFIMIYWEKTPLKNFKLIPPALIVVILGVVINFIFKLFIPSLYLEGIHLVNIPKVDSIFTIITFPDFSVIGNPEIWTTAITIAIIASVSTLLNVEATDNIDPYKRRTPPNRELIAQGIGNTISGLIGGIAITSVVVRSSVNIEAGGQTKLTTILHGFLLLMSVLFLSSVINLIPLATLSAILLLVGYKLASVTVLKQMYKKGWSQFIPFIVTIIAILLTDVLVGVLIGSGLSVFFLLRGNYYNPFFIENSKLMHGEVIKLELSNEVSFLNKASIKNTLWSVPDNSKVIIDATFSSYIDLDVVEILQDFENTFAKAHNIEVNMIGLKESYDLGEEIDFVDKGLENAKQKSTPEDILQYFKDGNKNYIKGKLISHRLRNKELTDFVTISPLAIVVTCIDFREPMNMLVNTAMGDLTILKASGNLADKDTIKNIEIACKKQGAKLILFTGNSENSLLKEALHAHLKGNTTYLNPLIEEAVSAMNIEKMELTIENTTALADEISRFNTKVSVERLLAESDYLYKKVSEGKIGIATAFFDRTTAVVTFSELYRPIELTEKTLK